MVILAGIAFNPEKVCPTVPYCTRGVAPRELPIPYPVFGFNRRALDLRRRIAKAVWINKGLKIVERLLFSSVHTAKPRGALVGQW